MSNIPRDKTAEWAGYLTDLVAIFCFAFSANSD